MFGVKIPKEGYVDMHTHILPAVDDGARDMKMALDMIRIAYEDGIRQIVATPHIHPDKMKYSNEEVYEKFGEFCEEVAKVAPEIKMYYGREYYCDFDAVEGIASYDDNGEMSYLTINNTGYLLVEFDVDVQYMNLKNYLRKLILKGYKPVVAHIERYHCLISHPERVCELDEMNLVLQINAMTITGKNGKEGQKFALKMIKDGLVDIIASDAHTNRNRCPVVYEAAKIVAKKCGKKTMEALFIKNPQHVINGEYMEDL